MDAVTRRQMLGTTAVGLLGAATGMAATTQAGDGAASQPDAAPEPHRGKGDGGRILGPTNPELQRQNPDLISPPATDRGKVMNMKYPFSLAHVRVEPGGWSREVTVRELPVSTEMAGVNMRLKRGAFRELHWHTTAEWAFMIRGNARITAVTPGNTLFVDDVGPGDVWFFPHGVPHSIQGLDSDEPEGGCEFLLVFDDGNFSEDSTFLLTDWLNHMPPEIVQRNLNITAEQLAAFPKKELFIYPCEMPEALEKEQHNRGAKPIAPEETYSFKMMKQKPAVTNRGGSATVADVTNFPASKGLIAAHVEVAPGGFRELHWHTIGDEWQYYLGGQGRMTAFTSGSAARTFDYRGGDVGYVPASMPRYIENTGTEPLRFLEVFKASKYDDLSLRQWLAMTPPNLVAGHLNLSKETLAKLPINKPVVLPE